MAVAVEVPAQIHASRAVVVVLAPAAARNWLGCWLVTGLSTAILLVASLSLLARSKSKNPKPL